MMATPRVRSWLIDTALPLWGDVGVDRDGPGFVEQLTLQGRPADVSFKRVRVQARQIYCFCASGRTRLDGQRPLHRRTGRPTAHRPRLARTRPGMGDDHLASRRGPRSDPGPLRHRFHPVRARMVVSRLGRCSRSSDRMGDARFSGTVHASSSGRRECSSAWRPGTLPSKSAHAFDRSHDRAPRCTRHERFTEETDELVGFSLRRFYGAGSARWPRRSRTAGRGSPARLAS